MVSLSKILLEEYKINVKGELEPKTLEDRNKSIDENKKKEKTLTPQNIMNAKANMLSTVTKAITTPEDRQNMKLLISYLIPFDS
jgi:hypothetical protein